MSRGRFASRGAPWALLLLAGIGGGCQLAFGDFEVTPDSPSAASGTSGNGGGSSSSGGQTSTPEACTSDEVVCDDSVVRRCVAGSWRETSCPPPKRCDPATGACLTCAPGEKRCLDDKTLQRCDAEGDRWVTEPVCEPGWTCDAELGACVACRPDLGVCFDTKVLCRCNAERTGFEPVTCPDHCMEMGTQDRCAGGEGVAGGPPRACEGI